jgi:hypothetical protein
MIIREVVKDSLLYPFTSLGNFLVLGILVMFTTIDFLFKFMGLGIFNFNLGIFGLMISLLMYGYLVRIISSSFTGSNVLPGFGHWKGLLSDGFKGFIVGILYMIPLFLISGLYLGLAVGGVQGSGPLIWILGIASSLYGLIFPPFFLLSLANMAFHSCKLEKALSFNETLEKISRVGWSKFIQLYVVVVLLCLTFLGLSIVVISVLNLVFPGFVGVLFVQLFLLPYLIVFVFRSSALFYASKGDGYLVCDVCEGYYELSFGERADDFGEKCQCGGRLRFVENLGQIKGADDEINDSKTIITRRKLVIFGLLAVIIGTLVIISPQVTVTTNKTLIGTYDVNDDTYYTYIDIPPEYENIEFEYNLTKTGLYGGVTGYPICHFSINGYKTNSKKSSPDYYESRDLLYYPDNGTLKLENGLKRLEVSHGGVKGTFKIYSVKMNVEYKWRF